MTFQTDNFEQFRAAFEGRLAALENRVAYLEGRQPDKTPRPMPAEPPQEPGARQVEIARLQEHLRDLELKLHERTEEGAICRKEIQRLQARLAESDNRAQALRGEAQNCKEECDKVIQELAEARNELERQKALNLPELPALLNLRKALQAVAPPFRPCVARYYDLENMSLFLTQCGQFARLQQCWQACRKAIMDGAAPGEIADFLLLILDRHNQAFTDNKCEVLMAEVGSDYEFENQDRLGPPGAVISAILLPGLIKPNGDIAVKCLVSLR